MGMAAANGHLHSSGVQLWWARQPPRDGRGGCLWSLPAPPPPPARRTPPAAPRLQPRMAPWHPAPGDRLAPGAAAQDPVGGSSWRLSEQIPPSPFGLWLHHHPFAVRAQDGSTVAGSEYAHQCIATCSPLAPAQSPWKLWRGSVRCKTPLTLIGPCSRSCCMCGLHIRDYADPTNTKSFELITSCVSRLPHPCYY